MIGLDTNILARYYIDDAGDAQTDRQRIAARKLIESGQPLMVCKTVVLELEWVMRGYYGFSSRQVFSVFEHLVSLTHVTLEDRDSVIQALSNSAEGLDFADALHLSSYKRCNSVATFDDRKFARRARKKGITPAVLVLSS